MECWRFARPYFCRISSAPNTHEQQKGSHCRIRSIFNIGSWTKIFFFNSVILSLKINENILQSFSKRQFPSWRDLCGCEVQQAGLTVCITTGCHLCQTYRQTGHSLCQCQVQWEVQTLNSAAPSSLPIVVHVECWASWALVHTHRYIHTQSQGVESPGWWHVPGPALFWVQALPAAAPAHVQQTALPSPTHWPWPEYHNPLQPKQLQRVAGHPRIRFAAHYGAAACEAKLPAIPFPNPWALLDMPSDGHPVFDAHPTSTKICKGVWDAGLPL